MSAVVVAVEELPEVPVDMLKLKTRPTQEGLFGGKTVVKLVLVCDTNPQPAPLKEGKTYTSGA
jgi:hypothetical protein